MKKGQAQVHWIFVIVAGSIILLFFVGFGFEYMKLQNTRLSSAVAMQFDNTINGLKIGEQYKIVDTSEEISASFNCDGVKINNNFNHKWEENIIFSPDKINSDKFMVWAKNINIPFGVDNIILISSGDYKIFIVESDYARNIVSSIPKQFDNVQLINYEELSNINFDSYENTKIVSFDDYDLDDYDDEAEIVKISKGDFGIIKINNNEYEFYGKAMIYGAIFSSDDNFNCSSKKLFKKAALVSNIYYNKALYLQDCCSKSSCNYNNIASDLRIYSELFKQQILNLNEINLLSNTIVSKNNDFFNKDCRVVF